MRLALTVAAWAGAAAAQETADDPLHPRSHFRVEHPAEVQGAQAEEVYERLLPNMTAGYRLSDLAVARDYVRWRRFNATPYLSATHGSRYVNNYANGVARDYGADVPPGGLPVGSVLVKDAFTVTEDGMVFSGPLAVMEKMPAGFDKAARNWKYVQIMPDGSLFGETGGENDAGMRFCVECHALAGDEADHLYFVPPQHRN
ncbi:MAG: hypothetical protein KDE35_04985 [Geminicoccaceae bacterium]|nr:hypothetical protein [Geminicoccaceae bacterium]